MRNSCNTRKIFLGIILIIVLVLIFNSNYALGVSPKEGLKAAADAAKLDTGTKSIGTILGSLFQKILGVMGLILLILFVIGGITWMTSEGNAEKLKKARGLLIHAIIGLIIILGSYALTKLVTDKFQQVIDAKSTEAIEPEE